MRKYKLEALEEIAKSCGFCDVDIEILRKMHFLKNDSRVNFFYNRIGDRVKNSDKCEITLKDRMNKSKVNEMFLEYGFENLKYVSTNSSKIFYYETKGKNICFHFQINNP